MDAMRREGQGYDVMDDAIDTMMGVYGELDDAKKYLKKAALVRERDKAEAETLREMSAQEMQHAEHLRNNVTRMLATMKEQGHECYEVLHKVWLHVSHRQMEYAAWIKQLQEMSKK